jgi:hypothetical protein
MISPYLAQEATRLRVATRPPAPAQPPVPKLIVSAKAEYRASDYRFARHQTDPAPLQKSRPIESHGAKLLRFAMIAFIFASLWAATSGVVWLLTSN